MYIFGGKSDNESLEDLLEYHFDARSWTVLATTGTPPSRRWGHSACVIGDRMYVFGGCDGSSCFSDLYEYDFGTRRWSLVDVPHCPAPRYFHMMVVEGERMYVLGGKVRGKHISLVYLIYVFSSFSNAGPLGSLLR